MLGESDVYCSKWRLHHSWRNLRIRGKRKEDQDYDEPEVAIETATAFCREIKRRCSITDWPQSAWRFVSFGPRRNMHDSRFLRMWSKPSEKLHLEGLKYINLYLCWMRRKVKRASPSSRWSCMHYNGKKRKAVLCNEQDIDCGKYNQYAFGCTWSQHLYGNGDSRIFSRYGEGRSFDGWFDLSLDWDIERNILSAAVNAWRKRIFNLFKK